MPSPSSSQREGASTREFWLSPNGLIHPHPPCQIQHQNSCVTIPSLFKQPNTACASENSGGNSGVRGSGAGPAPREGLSRHSCQVLRARLVSAPPSPLLTQLSWKKNKQNQQMFLSEQPKSQASCALPKGQGPLGNGGAAKPAGCVHQRTLQ